MINLKLQQDLLLRFTVKINKLYFKTTIVPIEH